MSSTEKQRSRKRTRNLFVDVLRKTLRPPEKITVSQWAEKYRILGESSNLKGRWNHAITPYLVGVMDAFNDPYIQEINFCKSTQVGGTEAMLNMLGWCITEAPANTMIVYPSDELGKLVSKSRLRPYIEKTQVIAERYHPRASKELEIRMDGMMIYLRGSNSPSKLASVPVKYLFFDETDKMEGATKKEASPYNLAKERTRTYTNSKKIVTISTPTLKTNYTWNLHEAADEQRRFFMPCPHCGKEIAFVFKQVKFDEMESGSNLERAATARYICQECGGVITDKDKYSMLQKGRWIGENKKCAGRPRSVSFYINALYSRFLTWQEIVKEFLDSKDDPEKLQNFVNSWLAEPWEDTKLKTSAELVMECRTEVEEFVVPDWAELLTGGIDVQENCIYWTIRAWGSFMTSQNICHGQALSLEEAENIMNLTYRKENGNGYLVSLALIDSGDQTEVVYDFCARNSEWALPSKGSAAMGSHFRISKVNRADSRAYGMNLVLIDVGKYKDAIAARMQRKSGRGAWMVYRDCDLEYANQVTAEHKIIDRKGGKKRMIWVQKTSHADNHYLDTEVYAFAAADIMGVRQMYLQEPKEHQEKKQPEEQPQEGGWLSGTENWMKP